MSENDKKCLLVVQLRKDSTLERLASDVPEIVKYVAGFSKGEHEIAFRSTDGMTFGFLLKTKTPQFLIHEFEKCKGTVDGDAAVAVEVGDLIGGSPGMARVWTWLQRH